MNPNCIKFSIQEIDNLMQKQRKQRQEWTSS